MNDYTCAFCGRQLNPKEDRIIMCEIDEEISDGFAGGRVDLPDFTLCADCYKEKIEKNLKY